MKILLLEAFYSGSHKAWAEGLQKHSSHEIEIISLPGKHWKWRMHGGAVSLAEKTKGPTVKPDLILSTDMIDLGLYLSLTRSWSADIPTVVYFHENQLNYPWSPTDVDVSLQRDFHYAFINYSSALAADYVVFNSRYHRDAFLTELPKFLKVFPDNNNLFTVDEIAKKSQVLPLGLDLRRLTVQTQKVERPKRAVILWNHRWEYDKNPDLFFQSLFTLADHGIDFNLVVLGESYEKQPWIFTEAKARLRDKILFWGYAESDTEYAYWLKVADFLPVTSLQDFFGISVVEAMYHNVVPLFPNRLAYHEHVPQQFHETFFYEEEDLLKKMQRRIMDVSYLRVMNTRQYVEKYDWSNMITSYDSLFENFATKSE